jgi:integrase
MTVIGPKLRAEAVLADKLAEYRLGLMQKPTAVTMAELLKDWLAGCESRLAVTTVSGYEIAIRKHISPGIGRIKLSELQPLHLQRFYAGLLKQGLSERTVEWIHTVCSASLKQAVRWGLINRNPADMVDAPKPKKKLMRVLDVDDLGEFLDRIDKCAHRDIFILALCTGMRRGELVAIRWGDVDFRRQCINVQRNTVRVKKQSITKTPKTDHSRRTVQLPASAMALLARMRVEASEVDGDSLLFTRKGKPILPSSVTSAFSYALKGSRFAGLRLHDMRHTHASLFLKAGGHSKVLQERLGHGSHATTMDVYAHLMPDMQRESVEKFDRLLEQGRAYQNATRDTPETQDDHAANGIKPA